MENQEHKCKPVSEWEDDYSSNEHCWCCGRGIYWNIENFKLTEIRDGWICQDCLPNYREPKHRTGTGMYPIERYPCRCQSCIDKIPISQLLRPGMTQEQVYNALKPEGDQTTWEEFQEKFEEVRQAHERKDKRWIRDQFNTGRKNDITN